MSGIEQFFLNAGFSWTLSKALPYVIAVILGIILAWAFRKKLTKNMLIKWLFRVTLLVLPFGLYFAFVPIYQGDFSNVSEKVDRSESIAELGESRLVVITIPNCPYCYESIDKMTLLKNRLPDAQIDYIVCGSNDEMSTEWYQEKGGDAIDVKLADSSNALAKLASGTFPTYVLVGSKKKPVTVWSNENFGVSAMDEIELNLQ